MFLPYRKRGSVQKFKTEKSPYLAFGSIAKIESGNPGAELVFMYIILLTSKSCKISARVHKFLCTLDISHPNVESIWVQIGSQEKSATLAIGCTYRPPDAKVQLVFWKDFEDMTEGLEGSDIVLLGDLNVDTMSNTDHNLRHLHSATSLLSLGNIVAEPTRISANSAKCLDLILTNLTQTPLARVEHVDFTDHALVSCTAAILNGKTQHLRRTITRRKWTTGKPNPGALEEALDRHMATLTSSGINEMWIEWRDKFTAALNEIAPRVTHTTKKHKSHCPVHG